MQPTLADTLILKDNRPGEAGTIETSCDGKTVFYGEGAVVFAPLVPKPTIKSAEPHRSAVAGHGRTARARENEDHAARIAGPEAAPSWDFSKVPVFSSGHAERLQRPPLATAPRLSGPIQTKLKVGAVNDPLEHEADRVADRVMSMPAPEISAAAPPQVSRKCAECEEGEEEKLHRKAAGPQAVGNEAPALVHEVLRSPGQPLDAATRRFFEPRFEQDFAAVRVHTDGAAGQSAREMNANAYTVRHDVVFGTGRFAPATQEGRLLLAHELTHVVQQRSGYAEGIQKQSPENGPDADDDYLYPVDHKFISGMGTIERLTGRKLLDWARSQGYLRLAANSTLQQLQERPGTEDEVIDDIYLLLVDRLWGQAGDPDTGLPEPNRFDGSYNARGKAVFELSEHWEEVARFLRASSTRIFEKELVDAVNRTPPDASLELRPDVIHRIRTKPYGHTTKTGRWGVARVGERYGTMNIADIFNPRGEEGLGTVWFFLKGHPAWFYQVSTTTFVAKDPEVAEVAAQVAEDTQFAAEILPLLIKVGAFGTGMSAKLAFTIASVALDELGEEGMREAKGEKHRSAWEIIKSASTGLVFAQVMNRVFGGGAAKEAAEAERVAGTAAKESAGSELLATFEDRAAGAVRHEVAAAEAPQVAAELRAGRARVSAEEGYVAEVDIVSEGQVHTYRKTKDGSWCRFSRPMCFETGEVPESARQSIEHELAEHGGFQEGFEGPHGDIVSDPRKAGNEFNEVRVPEGAHREVQLQTPSGRRPRVDLYIKGEEIISRKFPMGQLANDEFKALDYLQELYIKYPPRAPIRSAALKGELLEGVQVLEIPVQYIDIPERVLSYANSRNIVIRDIEGRVYNF
jgi:hypothetical protein